MLQSMLKPVSVGYALQNLTPGERVLEIFMGEHTPGVDGETNASVTELEVQGVDPDGQAYSSKARSTPGVPATWLPFGSNRLTPPDIRRKERVLVYQFADEDKYYWTELGLDDPKRRLETVIYVFNGNPDENSPDEINIENCYFFEVSTRTKQVTFQTSRANGEPFRYTAQFNTGEGRWTIGDDAKNYVEFDSANVEFRAHNSAGSYFEMVKKKVMMFAPDSVLLVGLNSFTVETKVFKLAASDSATFDTPQTTITGNCNISKNLTVVGAISAKSVSGGSVAGDSIKAKVMYADTYQNLPPR